MKNVKIKICGMREPENLREIAALEPDFIGLIFYPKSPRFISIEEAENLPQFSEIRRVGVFVNETVETILETTKRTNLFAAQLHGDETPEICAEIKRQKADLQIIKVFSVGADFNGEQMKLYEETCDYFLFDTKGDKRGGNGEVFDWRILSSVQIKKPFFLSGGIGAENVSEAIDACKNLPLFALDFNSRVEISAGVKSPQKVKEIIQSL